MAKNRVHPERSPRKSFDKYVKSDKNKFENPRVETTPKRPFDKKQWRLKTYDKKYRVERWEEKRKRKVLEKYYKELKNADKPVIDVARLYDGETGRAGGTCTKKIDYVVHPDVLEKLTAGKYRKLSPYGAARAEYERLKREKLDKKQAYVRSKAERDEALAEYRAKKAEKFKKLSRKTRKGQPVMKGRIEMILEKVQASINSGT